MSAPKIYRWDDDNAPVLNGVAGALNTLLLACLVEGYGSKISAGWTAPYAAVDKSIIALRNSPHNGSGFFLHVSDTDATTATLQGYEAMSDLNTGVGPFFSAAQTMYKSNAASTSARRWLLLATDSFMYLFVYNTVPVDTDFNFNPTTSNNTQLAAFCFGNFIRTNDEGFPCLLGLGSMDYSGTNVRTFGLLSPAVECGSAGSAYISAPRPLAATPETPTPLTLVRGGGPGYWISGLYGSALLAGPVYQPGQLFLSRPCLVDGESVNMRGFLPGWYFPCHGWENFTALALTTMSEDGRSFLVIPYNRYRGTNSGTSLTILIDLGDWS